MKFNYAFPILLALASVNTYAMEAGEYHLNAFGTLGATYLGGEDEGRGYGINGQTTDSWRGDQLSKLGGQIQYGLTDTISATAQVSAKAAKDSWEANLEWAYLSWQANNQLMVRAGRLRTPVYMYSESLDVGFSYPWLRLPDEVYSQIQLSNYEGVDLVFTQPTSYGTWVFQVAAGSAKDRKVYAFDTMHDMDYDDVFASNVTLQTDGYGSIRLGYAEAILGAQFYSDVVTPFGPSNLKLAEYNKQKGKFTSLGYQYDNGVSLMAAEATRRIIEGDGNPGKEAFYIMAGHRVGSFLPHLTYAQSDAAEGRESSWTAGINYALADNMTLKGEYKVTRTSEKYSGVFATSGQENFDNNLYAKGISGLVPPGVFGSPARTFAGEVFSVGIDFVF
jgi:hypothetical protein